MALKKKHVVKEPIPKVIAKGKVFVPERLQALNKAERYAVLATNAGSHPYTGCPRMRPTNKNKRQRKLCVNQKRSINKSEKG